jgi:hypothetical protein
MNMELPEFLGTDKSVQEGPVKSTTDSPVVEAPSTKEK